MDCQCVPCGDRMVLVQFPEEISLEVNWQVHRLARQLEQQETGGILELLPSYRSLGIIYDPRRVTFAQLAILVEQLRVAEAQSQPASSAAVEIPVAYGGVWGPDLEFVAAYHDLSTNEVIRLHTENVYRVYCIGFAPGFPYLGGLPSRLATPRMTEPRRRVAAGSVGIGGQQTGIYPEEGPGGWRIIGRTPLRLSDLSMETPFLLKPGDTVRFRSITTEQFQSLEFSE